MSAIPSRFSLLVIVLACLISTLSRPALAQSAPALTLSGGLVSVVEGDLAMSGFHAEGERRVTRLLSVVGQVHRVTGSGEGFFSTIDWTDLFVGGGLRVAARPGRWFQPYAQVLVGPYLVKAVESVRPNRFGLGSSGSYTEAVVSTVVGGGATFMPTPRVGFRAGADLQFYPGALPNGRLTLGLVVPIGRQSSSVLR